MFHGFSQSDVLVTTEIFLIGALCAEVSDPEKCAYGIAKWWGEVAPFIFSEKSTNFLCHEMNPNCQILFLRSWNCESCTYQIELFNQIMSSSKFANFVVEELSSEVFCRAPNFGENETEQCLRYTSEFIPKALQSLFTMISAREMCIEYFDQCIDDYLHEIHIKYS